MYRGLPDVCYLSAICLLSVCYLSAICLLSVFYLSAICLPFWQVCGTFWAMVQDLSGEEVISEGDV